MPRGALERGKLGWKIRTSCACPACSATCISTPIPKAHIADLHLKTLLDDSYTDAVLDLSVQMALDPSVGACSVSFELTDGGRLVASAACKAEASLHVQLPVKAPKLWSSESPYLYDLLLTVRDADGPCARSRSPARRLPPV